MDDDLRLGFHRLGRGLEDSANLGVFLAVLWAVLVWMVKLVVALETGIMFALIVLGVALLVVFRDRVGDLAERWRRGRLELEQHRGGLTHS
jgi:hypothetical protein